MYRTFDDLINMNMLLSTQRTGNFIVDTIFISGLMFIITSLSKYLGEVFNNLKSNGFNFGYNSIELRGTKYISTKWMQCRIESTKAFLAIIHKIKNLDSNTSGIKRLMELSLDRCSQDDIISKELIENTNINYILNQYKSIKLADGIYCSVTHDTDKINSSDNKGNITTQTFSFKVIIYSRKHKVNKLKEYVNECVIEYNDYLINNSINKRFFNYNHYDQDSLKSIFTSSVLNPNMRFETLFFDGKDKLYERVKFFTENENLYKEQGVPWTLGLLFYGDPGCGKTSAIKSIANMTKRHIINVPLGEIKTATELENIFSNPMIESNYYVPNNRRIYVIEDIDCRDINDIVNERSKRNTNEKGNRKEEDDKNFTPADKILMKLVEQNDESDYKKMYDLNKQKQLNMGNLLEIIDGINEMHGRILIITTNYREKLDKALTRPGRIDLEIEFKRSNVEDINNIYEKFYGISIKDIENIQDNVWTPAEIRKVLFENPYSPQQALEIIKSRVTIDTSDGEIVN